MSPSQPDPLRTLYDVLAAQQSACPTTVRDMPADDRRAYMREAKRRSRERQREAAEGGSPLPTDEAIRAALADAALMVLATDAPGAAQVIAALAAAFPGRAGVPGTVRARCRSGSLRPTTVPIGELAGTA